MLIRQPFLPSTKNVNDVHSALLERTGCSGILFSATFKEQAEEVGKLGAIPSLIEVPSLEEMVANFSRSFPYATAYQAIEDETAIIIHSSGTTGTRPISTRTA